MSQLLTHIETRQRRLVITMTPEDGRTPESLKVRPSHSYLRTARWWRGNPVAREFSGAARRSPSPISSDAFAEMKRFADRASSTSLPEAALVRYRTHALRRNALRRSSDRTLLNPRFARASQAAALRAGWISSGKPQRCFFTPIKPSVGRRYQTHWAMTPAEIFLNRNGR